MNYWTRPVPISAPSWRREKGRLLFLLVWTDEHPSQVDQGKWRGALGNRSRFPARKTSALLPDVPEVREDFADYLGEVAAWDAGIGAILDELEKSGEKRIL